MDLRRVLHILPVPLPGVPQHRTPFRPTLLSLSLSLTLRSYGPDLGPHCNRDTRETRVEWRRCVTSRIIYTPPTRKCPNTLLRKEGSTTKTQPEDQTLLPLRPERSTLSVVHKSVLITRTSETRTHKSPSLLFILKTNYVEIFTPGLLIP